MSYSVTYNSISGVSGSVPVDPTLYTSGGTVTVLGSGSLVKDGYAFSYWNTSADGIGTSYAPNSVITITSNINLYSTGWLPRVIYNSTNADSGSAPEDLIGYSSGTSVTVLGAGTLVRSGYSLTSWNTASDGSGTTYAFNSTLIMDSTPINLYPVWIGTYSVTYNGNGNDNGSAPVDSNLYGSDDAVIILSNTGSLTKSGYILKNWNTSADGSGVTYNFGSSVSISSSLVLYAIWKIVLSVTYVCADATAGSVPTDSTLYTSGGIVTVLGNTGGLTRVGYTFAGWGYNSTTYAGGNSINIVSNLELTGVWLKNYYITYNANEATSGSVPIDTNSYVAGSTITVSDNTGNLQLSNHTFIGWSLSTDGSGTIYKSGDSVVVESSDIVLYSVFISYTVKYISTDNTGGTVPIDSNEYPINGEVVTKLNSGNLSKYGYVFSGWGTSGNVKLYSAGDSFTINSNVELYPYWVKSITAKTFLMSGQIVDVCKIGSNIIKLGRSSTKSRRVFNIANSDINTAVANNVTITGVVGDLFNEVTSSGFESLSYNLNVDLCGFIDLSFTSLTHLSFYALIGSDKYYLYNSDLTVTGSSIRIPIAQYSISMNKSTSFILKIEASGSGIVLDSTSTIYLDRD